MNQKLSRQQQAILDAITLNQGVTNFDLVHQTRVLRYSARIHELRAKGYPIQTREVKRGLFAYYLQEEAQQ